MKKTDVFDRLDNVLGNYAENKATSFEVYQVAYDVNKYLNENPHPHDLIVQPCSYYIPSIDTNMNCLNCGHPKMMH